MANPRSALVRWRKAVAVIGATCALPACQSALNSNLPSGSAGYGVLNDAAAQTPVASRYQLQAGDRIAIDVFQENDLDVTSVLVDETGYVTAPLIGQIRAEGLSPAELAREMEIAYGTRFLRNPNVSVSLLEAVARTVSVEGEVERPGVYPMQPGYTLLSAIALAGSPTDVAKNDEILIFRNVNNERLGARFDLDEIRSGRMPDPQILAGDVVVVGYSQTRGTYQDFIRLVPALGIFTRF